MLLTDSKAVSGVLKNLAHDESQRRHFSAPTTLPRANEIPPNAWDRVPRATTGTGKTQEDHRAHLHNALRDHNQYRLGIEDPEEAAGRGGAECGRLRRRDAITDGIFASAVALPRCLSSVPMSRGRCSYADPETWQDL